MKSPLHQRWETFEHLADIAATATERPPDPPEGIPKQWLPGWIRWPIRVLSLLYVWPERGAYWVAKKIVRPPYIQRGACKQRGNCCHYLLIPNPEGVLARVFYFWYTQVQGFFLRRPEPIDYNGQKMVVMGCRYLMKDGRCKHYHLRPTLCREWPLIEHFGEPSILKGCGFWAEPR